jgi:hypothetical protein
MNDTKISILLIGTKSSDRRSMSTWLHERDVKYSFEYTDSNMILGMPGDVAVMFKLTFGAFIG